MIFTSCIVKKKKDFYIMYIDGSYGKPKR